MGMFQEIAKTFQRKKDLKSYLKNVKYSLKSHLKKFLQNKILSLVLKKLGKELEETKELELIKELEENKYMVLFLRESFSA